MMKAKYLTLLTLACLVWVACTREPIVPAEQSESVELDLAPAILQVAETRQATFGDANGKMPNRSSYGLFICDHHTGGGNSYTEYALRYNNIQVARDVSWKYFFFGYIDGFPFLFITPKDENRDGVTDISADIFAYAPYQQSVTTPESVPFSVTGAVDAMFAAENSDPVTNKNINPATDSRITVGTDGGKHLYVPLTFTHALALLEFEIRFKNNDYDHPFGPGPTNNYQLDYIQIDRRDGGHPLYASGKMNAMDNGFLFDLVVASGNTLTVSGPMLGRHLTTDPLIVSPYATTKAYILQVPSQAGETYTDGDYTFTFKFSGQEFPVKFTLLKSHIRHTDGTTYGFQPGYRYTFKFMIDNYVHFEGVTIGEWETVTTPFQTEI